MHSAEISSISSANRQSRQGLAAAVRWHAAGEAGGGSPRSQIVSIAPGRTERRTPAQLKETAAAQRLVALPAAAIVLKQDKSVVSLQADPQPTTWPLSLWTLEGLGPSVPLVRNAIDPGPHAFRRLAAKHFLRPGNALKRPKALKIPTDVAIQALLTLGQFKPADFADVVKATQAASKARGIKEIGDYLMRPPAAVAGSATMTPEDMKVVEDGGAIYQSLCFSCHANDGRGTPLAGGAPGTMMAPPLAGSPRVNGHRDYVIRVLLKECRSARRRDRSSANPRSR